MHVVYVFLPLVLASIVLGLVGFDIEDQGAPIIEGHLGESTGNNIEDADKNGKQPSYHDRVHMKNDNSIGKHIAPKKKCQGSSAKPANGGEVAYGVDTREKSSTPSPTATGDRKRGLAETGTDNETDSDNGRPEKLRKVAGGEVPWPHSDMMETSE